MNAYTIYRHDCDIFLQFKGHLNRDDAENSAHAFTTLVGSDTVRFIVDISELKSYDKEARIHWQNILKPLKKQIVMIYFVGDAPPLIRMAGSAVALAVGVHMKFVNSHSDVPP